MRHRPIRVALAAALPLALVLSCGKKEKVSEGKELSKNPITALGQLTDAAQKAADTAKEMEEMKPVDPVSFGALIPLLPAAPAGWTAAGEARGETTQAMGVKVSEAERSFEKGDQHLRVKIVDGAYNPLIYAGVTMAAQFARESTEGYEKGVTLDGNPGIEKWNKADKRAELDVVVAKRFLVSIEAGPVEPDFVRSVYASLDKAKLAALK
jgi:hypothetical protein